MKPVTNPELITALRRMGRAPSTLAQAALLLSLKDATYLAAEVVEPGSAGDGRERTLPPDEQVSFVSAQSGGRNFLPLFTDFASIRAYTKRAVGGVILPADEAWALILSKFEGAVVNPANDALPLPLPLVESLRSP